MTTKRKGITKRNTKKKSKPKTLNTTPTGPTQSQITKFNIVPLRINGVHVDEEYDQDTSDEQDKSPSPETPQDSRVKASQKKQSFLLAGSDSLLVQKPIKSQNRDQSDHIPAGNQDSSNNSGPSEGNSILVKKEEDTTSHELTLTDQHRILSSSRVKKEQDDSRFSKVENINNSAILTNPTLDTPTKIENRPPSSSRSERITSLLDSSKKRPNIGSSSSSDREDTLAPDTVKRRRALPPTSSGIHERGPVEHGDEEEAHQMPDDNRGLTESHTDGNLFDFDDTLQEQENFNDGYYTKRYDAFYGDYDGGGGDDDIDNFYDTIIESKALRSDEEDIPSEIPYYVKEGGSMLQEVVAVRPTYIEMKMEREATASRVASHDMSVIQSSRTTARSLGNYHISQSRFDTAVLMRKEFHLKDNVTTQDFPEKRKLCIMQTDYYLDNNSRPVMRVFGRTPCGKSVLCHIHNLQPYFFVRKPEEFDYSCQDVKNEINAIIRNQREEPSTEKGKPPVGYIVSCEYLTMCDTHGYNLDPRKQFIKITLSNPRLVPFVRFLFEDGRIFLDLNHRTYESNIPFVLRCSLDVGFEGCSWVYFKKGTNFRTIDDDKPMTSLCDYEFECDYKDINPISIYEESIIPNIRKLTFDIECTHPKNRFPDAETDPCIAISCYTSVHGNPLNTNPKKADPKRMIGNCTHSVIFVLKRCLPIEGAYVLNFDKEEDMLLSFRDFIIHSDPDALSGYNIVNFDLPYIFKRAEVLGILSEFSFLSRIKTESSKLSKTEFKSRAFGQKILHSCSISGRFDIDVLEYMRRSQKLSSYSLGSVSNKFLGITKDDIDHNEVPDMFENGSDEDRTIIAKYCIKDSMLTSWIADVTNMLVATCEMSRITGISLHWVFSRGQQIRVQARLLSTALRTDKKKDFFYLRSAVWTSMKGDVDSTTFRGAHVFSPKKGFYVCFVITLDYNSLYPSIIILSNLCYTTYISYQKLEEIKEEKGADFDEWFQEHVYRTPIIPEGDGLPTAGGHYFANYKARKGLLSTVLADLLVARKKVKKTMEDEKDPSVLQVLSGRELSLKVTANSVYGFTGAQVMTLKAIAESVTAIGQMMIRMVELFVYKKYSTSGVPKDIIDYNVKFFERNIISHEELVALKSSSQLKAALPDESRKNKRKSFTSLQKAASKKGQIAIQSSISKAINKAHSKSDQKDTTDQNTHIKIEKADSDELMVDGNQTNSNGKKGYAPTYTKDDVGMWMYNLLSSPFKVGHTNSERVMALCGPAEKRSMKVIYGDTDSIMIELDGKWEYRELVEYSVGMEESIAILMNECHMSDNDINEKDPEYISMINSRLYKDNKHRIFNRVLYPRNLLPSEFKINPVGNGIVYMEFEKAYRFFLLLSKKRYCGSKMLKSLKLITDPEDPNFGGCLWLKFDKIEKKGIESARRDYAPITTSTIDNCLDMLFKVDGLSDGLDKSGNWFSELLEIESEALKNFEQERAKKKLSTSLRLGFITEEEWFDECKREHEAKEKDRIRPFADQLKERRKSLKKPFIAQTKRTELQNEIADLTIQCTPVPYVHPPIESMIHEKEWTVDDEKWDVIACLQEEIQKRKNQPAWFKKAELYIYIRRIIQRIWDDWYPLRLFVITRSLSKRPQFYKKANRGIHVSYVISIVMQNLKKYDTSEFKKTLTSLYSFIREESRDKAKNDMMLSMKEYHNCRSLGDVCGALLAGNNYHYYSRESEQLFKDTALEAVRNGKTPDTTSFSMELRRLYAIVNINSRKQTKESLMQALMQPLKEKNEKEEFDNIIDVYEAACDIALEGNNHRYFGEESRAPFVDLVNDMVRKAFDSAPGASDRIKFVCTGYRDEKAMEGPVASSPESVVHGQNSIQKRYYIDDQLKTSLGRIFKEILGEDGFNHAFESVKKRFTPKKREDKLFKLGPNQSQLTFAPVSGDSRKCACCGSYFTRDRMDDRERHSAEIPLTSDASVVLAEIERIDITDPFDNSTLCDGCIWRSGAILDKSILECKSACESINQMLKTCKDCQGSLFGKVQCENSDCGHNIYYDRFSKRNRVRDLMSIISDW